MVKQVFAGIVIIKRLFKSLPLLFCLALLPGSSYAQFTIKPEAEVDQPVPPEVKDPMLVSPQLLGPLEYQTEAMRKMEKRRRRKQHNTLEIRPTLGLSQFTYTNWAKGGEDMFNGKATLYVKYTYSTDKFLIDNTFNGSLGLDIIDTIRFKSLDRFDIFSQGKWKINDHWSYSGDIKLASQFMKGYKSRRDKTYVSNFLSPGTLTVGLGFTYKPLKKENLEITLSPIAGQAIIVISGQLSDRGIEGIDKGKHFQPTIGPKLVIKYEKKLWKEMITYRMDFTSFYNFEYSPNVVYNSYLSLKPLKFMSIDYNCFMVYDEGTRTDDMTSYLQFNSALTLNLTYTFKNK